MVCYLVKHTDDFAYYYLTLPSVDFSQFNFNFYDATITFKGYLETKRGVICWGVGLDLQVMDIFGTGVTLLHASIHLPLLSFPNVKLQTLGPHEVYSIRSPYSIYPF
jgi:hypothetical protein